MGDDGVIEKDLFWRFVLFWGLIIWGFWWVIVIDVVDVDGFSGKFFVSLLLKDWVIVFFGVVVVVVDVCEWLFFWKLWLGKCDFMEMNVEFDSMLFIFCVRKVLIMEFIIEFF